eukprot:TRINITY_DN3304_c2_g3_i3.p1 TRINITY_DN3304_c2_g3~~TRINITY_DN3304_c2_g3_i3.p1  ORF type:complete len:201 (+),score=32.51 TRINITY_DN3304_c2_g3_i3:232-834(+)
MSRQVQLKVIILGDSGVGKTSLIGQYVTNRFEDRYKASVGADFCSKDITLDHQNIHMQIWDTAGQERFRALGSSFYRGSDCCMLVYDVTSRQSFESMEIWRQEFLIQAAPSNYEEFPFVVIGNKIDLEHRDVSKADAQKWCKGYNYSYFECSAKEGTLVETAFKVLAEQGCQRIESVAVHMGDEENAFPRKKQQSDDCDC